MTANMNRREFITLLGASAVVPASADSASPQHQSFDVCVVGGSCTGVFAAVRAAEAGMVAASARTVLFVPDPSELTTNH